MYNIREATISDREDLKLLYEDLQGETVNVYDDRIWELLKSEHDFLFVIDFNSNIVGTITVNICINGAFSNSNYAVFENMIVRKEFRKLGIGSFLLNYLEEFVKNKGCTKIHITSSLKREDAHRVFIKHGYSITSKSFKKFIWNGEKRWSLANLKVLIQYL